MARINRQDRPTRITPADLERCARADARDQRAREWAAAKARLCRLGYWAAVLTVGIALFYAATN